MGVLRKFILIFFLRECVRVCMCVYTGHKMANIKVHIKGNISVGSTAIYGMCIFCTVNFFNSISSRFPILMRPCNINVCVYGPRMKLHITSRDNHLYYDDGQDDRDVDDDESIVNRKIL